MNTEPAQASGPRCASTPSLSSEAEQFQTALSQPLNDARYPRLLVFVSFSMPLATLKALGRDVQKAGGKLVFRGLVHNSFKEMAKKLQELGCEALIDPTLFTAFNIRQVPAFVHRADGPITSTTSSRYDVLYGQVSLRFALEQFVKTGEVSGVKALLDRLGREP